MKVHAVSEVTRRAILEQLALATPGWAGRLSETEFLARLYDLTALPSTDSRFENAAADIEKHRIDNGDWPDDWVFSDSRFDLLGAPDADFLRFLCETVHPVVRADTEQVGELVNLFNDTLRFDGWKLVEGWRVSGRPIYRAVRFDLRVEMFDEPTGWEKVDRQLREAKRHLEAAQAEEQFQAVGLMCREALISVAQAAFDASRHATIDDVEPSGTDARRMLEALFESELRGGSNEEARAYAKAALKLAAALQHKRTADFTMAALCCEATTSVVSIAAIVSGRRG